MNENNITISIDLVTEKLENALILDLELKEEGQKIALEWALRYLADLGIRMSITQNEYERLKIRPFVKNPENENTNA